MNTVVFCFTFDDKHIYMHACMEDAFKLLDLYKSWELTFVAIDLYMCIYICESGCVDNDCINAAQ